MSPSCRWIFRISEWKPTCEQVALAFSCVQPEEKLRLSKFYFQRDCKSSLIGRLLMRKLIADRSKTPYMNIKFIRNEHNKPILAYPNLPNLSFNISHQGDFAVLAGENTSDNEIAVNVGIDVMQIEVTGTNKNLERYFKIMKSQFTDNEWKQILNGKDDRSKLENFTRFWCLKESYVKAIGIGITMELTRIDFQCKSPLNRTSVVTDTVLKVDGISLSEWTFEEVKLDEDHIVAVASTNKNHPAFEDYKNLTFEELVGNANKSLVGNDDESLAAEFMKKPFSPSSLKRD